MNIFFADDSSQAGVRPEMGRLIAVGGALIGWQALKGLARAIEDAADATGVPRGTELKWSPPPDNWIYQNLKGEARKSLYRQVLQAAQEHGARCCVVVWDTGRTTLQGDEAFARAMDFLFERISMHCSTKGEYFTVVADRPGGGPRQDDQFLERFLQRVETGTEYVPPDRCLLNLLTTPSHLQRHLQIADLVVGVTTAMVAGRYKYAQPLFAEIRPLLIQNALGYVGGTGLKLFPDDLANLYHWVLEESAFTKAKSGLGWKLPSDNLPYFVDLTA
jgi:hypothetical protein